MTTAVVGIDRVGAVPTYDDTVADGLHDAEILEGVRGNVGPVRARRLVAMDELNGEALRHAAIEAVPEGRVPRHGTRGVYRHAEVTVACRG